MTENPLEATVTQKAVLFDEVGRLLLLRDGSDATSAEEWQFPGGRIEVGEDTRPALRRELREETGLDPALGEPVSTAAWLNDRGEGRYAVFYRCEAEATDVTLSAEHTEYAWVTPAEAREEYLAYEQQYDALARAEARR